MVRRDGPVLRVTLDRPERGNALTPTMVDGLLGVLAAAADSDVRVVSLTGSPQFCSGMDLGGSAAADGAGGRRERPRTGHIVRSLPAGPHGLIRALNELPVPVVASVRGLAAGIGLSIALSADYVIASTEAQFWAPFVARGFSPDSASTYLLPRLVGVARAKEMLLLGRKIDASTAAAWGLINAVTADADLEQAAEEVVQEFAHAATVTVGVTRATIRKNQGVDLGTALENEALAVELTIRSDDFKEGVRAFVEHRTPNFSGR